MSNILLLCGVGFAVMTAVFLFVNTPARTIVFLVRTLILMAMVIMGVILVYSGRITLGAALLLFALFIMSRFRAPGKK